MVFFWGVVSFNVSGQRCFDSMYARLNIEKKEKIGLEGNKVMGFELNWQQLEPGPFLIVEKNVIVCSSIHMQF